MAETPGSKTVSTKLDREVVERGRVGGRVLSYADAGTPQGGVISPLLANVYLHEVLDEWFVHDVIPRLRGRAVIARYADDFVRVFSREDDARRVHEVLPKRLAKYGLTLHPEKTRWVAFRRPGRTSDDDDDPGSFDLLGFTHHWALSRRGSWVVKRRTANDRFARALERVTDWCKEHRHAPIGVQWRTLVQKLRGHYGYYGVAGNSELLARFLHEVTRVWRTWLSRRSQRGGVTWERMGQIHGMKSRMREFCMSGSVGGPPGDRRAYPRASAHRN